MCTGPLYRDSSTRPSHGLCRDPTNTKSSRTSSTHLTNGNILSEQIGLDFATKLSVLSIGELYSVIVTVLSYTESRPNE